MFVDDHVNFINGMLILISSIILSYILTEFLEKPLRHKEKNKKLQLFYFPSIVIVILSSALLYQNSFAQDNSLDIDLPEGYKGALILDEQTEKYNDPELELYPSLTKVQNDLAISYEDKCQATSKVSENITCYYGDTENYKHTVALVGGSHSAHWLGAFLEFAEEDHIRIANITKSGCRFSTDQQPMDTCNEWNKTIINTVTELNPDIVFAPVDISTGDITEVPDGFLKQFEALEKNDIAIFGVRDTPRLRVNIPECLSLNDNDMSKCSLNKDKFIISPSPWDKLDNKPSNVIYHDYSKYFCPTDKCLPAIGNVIVYIDSEHISQTYMKTLSPIIRRDIQKALLK